MYYMFFGCSGLTALDVTNFSTTNVTTMSFMFAECLNLKAIDVMVLIRRICDLCEECLETAKSITELDLSHFKTGKVQLQQRDVCWYNLSLSKISLGIQFYSLTDTQYSRVARYRRAYGVLIKCGIWHRRCPTW